MQSDRIDISIRKKAAQLLHDLYTCFYRGHLTLIKSNCLYSQRGHFICKDRIKSIFTKLKSKDSQRIGLLCQAFQLLLYLVNFFFIADLYIQFRLLNAQFCIF